MAKELATNIERARWMGEYNMNKQDESKPRIEAGEYIEAGSYEVIKRKGI